MRAAPRLGFAILNAPSAGRKYAAAKRSDHCPSSSVTMNDTLMKTGQRLQPFRLMAQANNAADTPPKSARAAMTGSRPYGATATRAGTG